MPPVGRPPAERNVYSFEGRLLAPPELVLDTSFVVDALVTTQPRHEVCQRFLAAMAETGSTVYFNMLLEAELWEAAYAIAIRELHSAGRWRTARRDGRTRRRARALRERVERAWTQALDALDWVPVDVGEVAPWIPEMMGYGLRSNDAVHAATAAYVAVPAFVTLDYDFSLVPQRLLDLYVPSNRVAACRNQRARR